MTKIPTIRVDVLVKARKRHQCEGCLTSIEPREIYKRMTWITNGCHPYRLAYHVECRAEEDAMNKRIKVRWDDPKVALHEYVDRYPNVAAAGLPPEVHDHFVEREFRRRQNA